MSTALLRDENQDVEYLVRVVSNIRDHLAIVDRQYRYQIVNRAYENACNLDCDQIVGRSLDEIWGNSRFKNIIKSMVDRCFSGEEAHYCGSVKYPGYSKAKDMEVMCYPFQNGDGTTLGAAITAHDLGEIKEVEHKMRELAYIDPLTQMPNRRFIEYQLEKMQAHSRRKSSSFTVFYCDINKFKSINDEYGHNVGDAVLVEVANRLRSCLRSDEHIGRVGGDEFVLVTNSDLNENQQWIIRHRLKDAMNEPMHINNMSFELGVSVGCASWPTDGREIEKVMDLADRRMYLDKPKPEFVE